MPTFSASSQGASACQKFALNMAAYFEDHRPDVVIMSADWLEYARPPRFDGMVANVKETISRLNQSSVSVVLMGPGVQFKSRLPSMLMRARLRNVDPTPEEFELPTIFSLDQMMKAALPPQAGFSYVSVLDAVCPARQCPLTVDHDAPLSWDHAHLTAEGSVYAARRIARLLRLPGSLPGPGASPARSSDGSSASRFE
jgi:hypothetical protein